MGDYLSELAAKNIGTADVIKPRRAARFEPNGMSVNVPAEPLFFQPENFDHEHSFEDERSKIKPDLRPRGTRLNRKDELGASHYNSYEQIPQPEIISPTKQPSPIKRQINEHISIQSKMIEEVRETTNEILSSPHQTSPPIRMPKKSLPASGDAVEETKSEVKSVSIQPRFGPKITELKMPETKISEPPIVERKIIEKQIPIVAKPSVSKAENHFGETTANQRKILTPLEKMSKQTADNSQSSNFPVINVTIGRVEVRAIAGSAAVKEKRPKPPTLSLEEYLRERNSGGGR